MESRRLGGSTGETGVSPVAAAWGIAIVLGNLFEKCTSSNRGSGMRGLSPQGAIAQLPWHHPEKIMFRLSANEIT